MFHMFPIFRMGFIYKQVGFLTIKQRNFIPSLRVGEGWVPPLAGGFTSEYGGARKQVGVREVLMGSVKMKAVKKRKGFMKKVGRGCGGEVQFGGVVGKSVCFILV